MLEDAKLVENDYDSGQRSWGTFLNVDGTRYATSLFWQPLQNTSDPFQEVEDASAGVLEGADLFCIKGGKAPQFGICVSHEGYRSGENVAAVSLATALSNVGSFIAVFKVPQGWWYTCIRNDIILSDGDMLFLSEEEAKNQFLSMLAVPDWGKKIAPKSWEIEDTEEMDVGDLLSRGARSKLQKIKALRGTKLLMVVVISAVVGLWLVSSLIDSIFLTPTVRPVVVPVRPKVAPKQPELPPEIKPWEKVVNPQAMMSQCYEGIVSLVKILPPGWTIGNLTCTPQGIATSWRRNIGRMAMVKKALDESGLNFSGKSFSADGNTISATLPLKPIEPILSQPKKNVMDLQNEINDTFQAIGYPISMSPTSITSDRGTVFRMLQIRITSKYNPLVWIKMLTKYSGLEIKTITYDPNGKTWNYEGIIYVL